MYLNTVLTYGFLVLAFVWCSAYRFYALRAEFQILAEYFCEALVFLQQTMGWWWYTAIIPYFNTKAQSHGEGHGLSEVVKAVRMLVES